MKLLFIINPSAGTGKTDWEKTIRDYFAGSAHSIHLFNLPYPCQPGHVKEAIDQHRPDRIIAVGGDGTLKLVVESAKDTKIPIGILPGGSANGMAKEIGIVNDPQKALDIAVNGEVKLIDLISINDQICIHLSDIGFNAFVVKTFETFDARGMWGYIKAAWKVLWRNRRMQVSISLDNQFIRRDAAMVVLANASKYGTGAVVNPEGELDDGLFEVIVMKRLAFSEIVKMMITHKPYDPKKVELFHTTSLTIQSKHQVHFQVDGEYLDRVNNVEAGIIPRTLNIIVPKP
jgi:diacylglycerol kinase (ATP)